MKETKVYTETTCGICGKVDKRDGAEGFCPPVGWAEVTLTYRLKGSGWTNNVRHEKQVCPKCANKIRDFIKEQEV